MNTSTPIAGRTIAATEAAHLPAALAADIIALNLAPAPMVEPARDLLMAVSKRDVAGFEVAVRAFEKKVMLDATVSAYGGRWLAGVAKAHVPGLSQVIRMDSLLGELRGGGDVLVTWVAQCWVETDGYEKLVQFADMLMTAWREVHTDHAIKFACALATSLAVVQTKVAAKLVSTIDSVPTRAAALEPIIDAAECWVDVGCVLSQLSPPVQCLLEERLANSERRWEWSSPLASQALVELRPHLSVPSKALNLFQTIVWEDVWPVDAATEFEINRMLAEAKKASSLRKLLPKKEEPVRLLVLVTILFGMTLVYNSVNAQRQMRPITSAFDTKRSNPATQFGTKVMKPGVS